MIAMTLLLLAIPQDQTSAATRGNAVTVPAGPAAEPDKMICTREVPVGSMLAKKVCRSASKRAASSRDTADALARARSANGLGVDRN